MLLALGSTSLGSFVLRYFPLNVAFVLPTVQHACSPRALDTERFLSSCFLSKASCGTSFSCPSLSDGCLAPLYFLQEAKRSVVDLRSPYIETFSTFLLSLHVLCPSNEARSKSAACVYLASQRHLTNEVRSESATSFQG